MCCEMKKDQIRKTAARSTPQDLYFEQHDGYWLIMDYHVHAMKLAIRIMIPIFVHSFVLFFQFCPGRQNKVRVSP